MDNLKDFLRNILLLFFFVFLSCLDRQLQLGSSFENADHWVDKGINSCIFCIFSED